ncbi:hypothetical protein J2Z21_005177 [Streptomyces griseochromogenes]|uniref:TetR family transcriptional regulator n=1 Tax=Streptomyces griseochromogenes TaxID=68214 RepID=A0ABS4LXQ1_9ACTN|nr:hypothetical protein [Streptomyces griseochromogenes]MBP2052195.1 hypothetical protein [Streptomyces griseochromogenes]
MALVDGIAPVAVHRRPASSFDDHLTLFENMIDELVAPCGVPRKR